MGKKTTSKQVLFIFKFSQLCTLEQRGDSKEYCVFSVYTLYNKTLKNKTKTQVLNIHEGSIASFYIRSSFMLWIANWEADYAFHITSSLCQENNSSY